MPGLLRLQARIVAEEMLRPDAEHHLRRRTAGAALAAAAAASAGGAVGSRDRHAPAAPSLVSFGRDEIHRRRAHEAGDEHVGRAVVDGLRLVELLDARPDA